MARSPERLKSAIGSGLLSFPVTHFTDEGAFAPLPYQDHIDYLVGHRPQPCSRPVEPGSSFRCISANTRASSPLRSNRRRQAAGRRGRRIWHGVGDRIRRRAEKAGADGILLLPQYLIQAEQEGLYRHIVAICRAVGIGAMVYHRDNCLFELDTDAKVGGCVPELDRLQGWPWQCRAIDVPSRDPWRPAGLYRRDADGGGIRSRQSGDRRLDLFFRHIQFLRLNMRSASSPPSIPATARM